MANFWYLKPISTFSNCSSIFSSCCGWDRKYLITASTSGMYVSNFRSTDRSSCSEFISRVFLGQPINTEKFIWRRILFETKITNLADTLKTVKSLKFYLRRSKGKLSFRLMQVLVRMLLNGYAADSQWFFGLILKHAMNFNFRSLAYVWELLRGLGNKSHYQLWMNKSGKKSFFLVGNEMKPPRIRLFADSSLNRWSTLLYCAGLVGIF